MDFSSRGVHLGVMAAWGACSVCLLGGDVFAGEAEVSCQTCHVAQSEPFAASVHKTLACQACHKGSASYHVSPEQLPGLRAAVEGNGIRFNHGESFLGKPARADIPALCGECHSDVQRMNSYGLPTDQLSRYWTSGHGTTLKTKGDDRVAVCIDCHGSHDIARSSEPTSRTHPLNIPGTCAVCHADEALMGEYDLPVEVVSEYRASVHGKLLTERGDTGAPTCVTCHGNHSAIPSGYGSVMAVCGKCHQHASNMFATSVHAGLESFRACVQCHGGGEGRNFHLIERITKPPGILIQRYKHLLASEPQPTTERITEAIHPNPQAIIKHALATCMDCHDDLEDDESLPKLFGLLEDIAEAERHYVRTAKRLDEVGQGVLLVNNQRFLFEDATTHLIELAPVQHTLNNEKVDEKVKELTAVCDQVNSELDGLESGLRWRYRALIPVWVMAGIFALALHVKYKKLKHAWVKEL